MLQSDEPRAASREPRAESVWGTFGCERTVLVVARTLTSTYRLLEALELFRDDFRIKFVFTVNDTSAFSHGVRNVLRQAGVRLVPWQSVSEGSVPYDLALSASENVDFEHLAAHTVVLPHGLGFNKFVPDSNGGGVRLAGLPPEWVLRDGKVTVVLSHPEQREQLETACPASTGRLEVVGDPTLDRLAASTPLRARYREALGTGERTLVTLASTWRPDSLLGRWRTLPARLLGELPSDLYQVCAALHPNIWAFYGESQISLWLSSALDAGLVLLPPEAAWQVGLIAADQVIADHGSLSLFAAALDRPLLLTGPTPETVPGTPPDALARAAAALEPHTPLRKQIDRVRSHHQPGQFDPITSRVFARTGDATTNLRNLIYRKLDLSPGAAAPSLRRIPVPGHRGRRVRSSVVQTVAADGESLNITRFPAAAWQNAYDVETHLVADETEPDLKIVERAAAITRDLPLDTATAEHWARSTLAAFPGARIAITPTSKGCLAAVRDRASVRITLRAEHVQLAASAVYCCLLSGALHDRGLTVHAGATTLDLRLEIIQPGTSPAGP